MSFITVFRFRLWSPFAFGVVVAAFAVAVDLHLWADPLLLHVAVCTPQAWLEKGTHMFVALCAHLAVSTLSFVSLGDYCVGHSR